MIEQHKEMFQPVSQVDTETGEPRPQGSAIGAAHMLFLQPTAIGRRRRITGDPTTIQNVRFQEPVWEIKVSIAPTTAILRMVFGYTNATIAGHMLSDVAGAVNEDVVDVMYDRVQDGDVILFDKDFETVEYVHFLTHSGIITEVFFEGSGDA